MMKANEAIDIVEELLKEFREESENGLTLESEKDALEIVLESAKVLHELIEQEGIDSLDDERYPNAHRIYIDDEGVLTIKSDVLKKIGVELDE